MHGSWLGTPRLGPSKFSTNEYLGVASSLFSVVWPVNPRGLAMDVAWNIEVSIWVNYNDLTATSLGMIVSKGNHPNMAWIQVSEVL